MGIEPVIDQPRLLTLPQAEPRRPGPIVTAMPCDEPEHFRWSYRSFAFRSYGSYNGGLSPT